MGARKRDNPIVGSYAEHRKKYNAELRLKNKEHIQKQQKEYRLKNKKHIQEYHKKRYLEKGDEIRSRVDKVKKAAANVVWAIKNRQKCREISKLWGRAHPEYVAAKCRAYQALKIRALPRWANRKYMQLFYLLSKEEEKRTGKKCHVDHIVPLKSDLVCGLHCEHNLQLLFDYANKSKGNRTWPNHPSIEA